MDTGDRKWGTPYLTRAFFDILGATMADKVVLVMAEADGRPVGGALNLRGDDTLYGRYWGCLESHAFLHFEACYYQAIDYAIAHGLAARRGRRAGRPQDPARLPAGADLLGALDRRSGLPPRRRRLPEARAAGGRAGDRRADAVLAVPERNERRAAWRTRVELACAPSARRGRRSRRTRRSSVASMPARSRPFQPLRSMMNSTTAIDRGGEHRGPQGDPERPECLHSASTGSWLAGGSAFGSGGRKVKTSFRRRPRPRCRPAPCRRPWRACRTAAPRPAAS